MIIYNKHSPVTKNIYFIRDTCSNITRRTSTATHAHFTLQHSRSFQKSQRNSPAPGSVWVWAAASASTRPRLSAAPGSAGRPGPGSDPGRWSGPDFSCSAGPGAGYAAGRRTEGAVDSAAGPARPSSEAQEDRGTHVRTFIKHNIAQSLKEYTAAETSVEQ